MVSPIEVGKLAKGKIKDKKAWAALTKDRDWDGLRELAREILGRGEGA